MVTFIYKTLESIGFTHPLHPAITHLPMGMIMGGFIFALLAFRKEALWKSAHYSFIVALVFAPPTIILGIMDWLYRYRGNMDTLFTLKFIFAGTLLIVLSAAVYLGQQEKRNDKLLFVMYLLSLFNAIALGFTGGAIAYG